ncbi:TerB family tellurite resistance protein [Pseudoalteromonas phenolica]|uniref:TerB family tellurite resistance protein n=1 Tax=Pseudoalteromonas phenolica TaxID=161398 RepID=A0A5R9Q121_9GAMM|nr:TerB family tellurite resistance protein [Pseudoalteromonas phenolica]TLX46087.1 TerB family tellurite resistance protein [Pseudoalteromonas phenolica]
MFLNRLTINEKQAFLVLAHHVAHSDNDFSMEEEILIAKYCMEMQMDDIEYDEARFDLASVLNTFECDSHQKIALLELMALIHADGNVAKEEQQLLNDMVAHFGLNPNLVIIYREWSKNILSLFTQGEALIHL